MTTNNNVISFPFVIACQTDISAIANGYQYINQLPPCSPFWVLRPFRFLSIASVVFGLFPATGFCALTLTDLSFISNGGSFINNTIVDSASPIGFTAVGLGQPFLNNSDSTISLTFGSYYAYSFLGFGQHVGGGTISGNFDGTPFSQAVTFPSDPTTVANFCSITFSTGDTLTIGTTNFLADRIRIVADGGGLVGDGNNDVIYSFNFAAVPEPSATALLLGSVALTAAIRRRKK